MLVGFLTLQGCVKDVIVEPEGTFFQADPSVIALAPGSSTTTTIKAFDGLTREATDVAWAVGAVGPGISVREDSSYGRVYIGERLALPSKSQTRRFVVTFTGDAPSSFVVSGDASSITITVRPAIPTPWAVLPLTAELFADPSPAPAIWTIGHSTRPLQQFSDLLDRHAIEAIADVRRFPSSRRYPHFNQAALAASLAHDDRDYLWLPSLGGRRNPAPDSPNTAWRNLAFRGYADHLASEEFAEGLFDLLMVGLGRRTAVMCAEAIWWHCHRGLIADVLCAIGVKVFHITDASTAVIHPLTPPARIVEGQLTYESAERDQLSLTELESSWVSAFFQRPEMSHMEVRQLEAPDTESLIRTFASSLRPADFFERCARDHWSGKRVVLVAMESGRPVGFVVLTWNASYPPFEFAGVPEIGDLTLGDDFRADEIARALFSHAEELVQDRGYARVGTSTAAGDKTEPIISQSGYLPDGRGRHLTRAGPVEYFIKLLPAPALQRPVERSSTPSTWGRRLAGAYILLLAMAAGYVSYRLLFAGPRSQFVGIILVLFSYPWGRLLAHLFQVRGGAGATLVLILSYAINTGLLYVIGGMLERLIKGNKSFKSPDLRSETP
jgi:GNAT superfamily N-acetyltransferase